MDTSSIETDDLKGIIESLGFETQGLSRQELENLLATLQPPSDSSGHNSTGEMSGLNEGVFFTDSMIKDMVENHAFDSSENQSMEVHLPQDESFSAPMDEVSNVLSPQEIEEINAASEAAPSSLTEDQQRNIVMLCGITGMDAAYANTLLEAANWNVDTAVTLFFDGESRLQAAPVYPPAAPPRETASQFVAPPQHPMAAREMDFLGGFHQHLREHLRGEHVQLPHDMEDDDDDMGGFRRQDVFDEDGVRVPDPVRAQRLLSERSMSTEDDVLGRADAPGVDWMFEPPRDISFPGTIEQAREVAMAENKWVLVNIQSHSEFSSQLLNRDTWSDESLRAVISASFVFWQRGHTSRQGQRFMSMYRVQEDDLPQIFIVSPNTGAKVFTLTGLIEPIDLVERLVGFIDKQSSQAMRQFDKPVISPAMDVEEAQKVPQAITPPQAEEEVPAAAPLADYGPVPSIPDDKDTTGIKVAIKLSNGKSYMRRYSRSDPVRALFAVAIEQDQESAQRPFDLISRFPAKNLSSCLDETLEACGLAGGQVFHRWL